MKLSDRRKSRKGNLRDKFKAFTTDYGETYNAIPQGQGPEVVEEAGDELRHGGDDHGPASQETPHQEAEEKHHVEAPKPAPRKRKAPSKKG